MKQKAEDVSEVEDGDKYNLEDDASLDEEEEEIPQDDKSNQIQTATREEQQHQTS